MLKYIKKVAEWYFSRSNQTYVWLPSGTIPCNRLEDKKD